MLTYPGLTKRTVILKTNAEPGETDDARAVRQEKKSGVPRKRK